GCTRARARRHCAGPKGEGVQAELVVFADYTCPWCYLADVAVRRLRREGRIRVEGAAFELRPRGLPLADGDDGATGEEWDITIAPLAAGLGVEIVRPTFGTRTRKAHEAAAFARSVGRYDNMHEAIYDAWWRQGRDIGRIDVLVEIGTEAGLDPGALRVALDIDQWTARVEHDETLAKALGVQVVPAYVRTGAGT